MDIFLKYIKYIALKYPLIEPEKISFSIVMMKNECKMRMLIKINAWHFSDNEYERFKPVSFNIKACMYVYYLFFFIILQLFFFRKTIKTF